MRMNVLFFVSFWGLVLAPILAAQEASLIGHYEGSIVLVAAEQEVDVVVDFHPTDGQLKGQLRYPVTADGSYEVEKLEIQGSRVSFSVHDPSGVVSAFDGALSPDGRSLQGTMKESGRGMPFILRQVQAVEPAREVPTYRLKDAGIELAKAFNADVGKVRILLLLNPISFSSRMALRIVERYVMDQINDPDLRVYVIWMAPGRQDSAQLIQHVATLAPDPRVTHFWSTDRSVASVFEPMLALYKPAANPCMLFGPDRSWTAPPPLPDRVRQSPKVDEKIQLDPAQRLNGIDLATDVQRLLAARRSR